MIVQVSSHILDTTLGKPAAGVVLTFSRLVVGFSTGLTFLFSFFKDQASSFFKALPQCLVMQGDQNNARWTQISSRVTNQARTKQS